MEGNFEKIEIEPILVSRFSDIRKDPHISPVEEDFSNTFESSENRKHFFNEAKKAFEFVFDKEKFVQNIKLEPNEKSFSYLKKVRRYGLVLKASYKFFDIRHKCGEQLNHFLFLLGEYNDSYWMSPKSEVRDEIISSLDDMDLSVNFSDTVEFKEYTRGVLSKIELLLENTELPMDEFHRLRKRLRLISNFMQVAAAENYNGNFHWLFYSIFKMSEELGKVHDDYVQSGLKKEIVYQDAVVKVNSKILSEYKKVKPFVEKICGLV